MLSSFISSFPFVLAISLTSGTTLYHMVNFHPGFSHYCYFCINLFCSFSVAEGCMLLVAAVVSNLLLAIGTAAGITVSKFIDDPPYCHNSEELFTLLNLCTQVLMIMPSNVFRRAADIPKFFWRYPMSYISYVAWSIQVQMSVQLPFPNQYYCMYLSI